MAAFVTTDLKSTTYEDAMLELAERVQILESNATSNPTGVDNVSVSYDAGGTANVSFSVPVDKSISATGQVVTSAKEYLTTI